MLVAQNRRRMLFALVLLLIAITIMLVREHTFSPGSDEVSSSDDSFAPAATTPPPMPVQVAQSTPVAAVPAVKKHHRIATPAAQPSAGPAVVVARRAAPPLQIELVVDGKKRAIQPDTSAVKVDVPASASTDSTVSQLRPVTNVVQRAPISASAPPPYPLLANRTNVQGAVLLQALIAADGVIRDLRVISGPLILSSAARVAALQWRFKPYLQDGKAVETQARITVNFLIKVSDDRARDVDAHKHNPIPSNSPSANPGD
jgi:outer membrane biosynthesis protein TonB